MHHDRAHDQEPDHDLKDFELLGSIFALMSVHLNLAKELPSNVEVEHCAYADRSEKAHKRCVLPMLDLVNLLMESQDHGKASEEQDEDTKGDEAINRYHAVIDKAVPWTDSAEPKIDC